jgi:hypothetical protein
MSNKPENPLAFAHNELNDDGSHYVTHSGMTLRDYFAAAALAQTQFHLDAKFDGKERQRFINDLSAVVYEIADAMLKARAP